MAWSRWWIEAEVDGAARQSIPGVAVHVLQREADGWRTRVASFTRVQGVPLISVQKVTAQIPSNGAGRVL